MNASQNNELDSTVRAIGSNIAFEGGVRIALSYSARLILGYIGGLPPTAISINATIAFFMTAVLEIPAGIYADLFDPVKAVRLGYLLQAICAALLLLGIGFNESYPQLMWICIIVEAVLDSGGNALISGAKEASFQKMIEAHSATVSAAEFSKLKTQYLSLAERYGRWHLVLWPLITVPAALWLNDNWHASQLVFIVIGIAWLLMRHQFPKNLEFQKSPSRPGIGNKLQITARSVTTSLSKIKMIATVYFLAVFAYINVSSYLIVSVLKDGIFSQSVYLPTLTVCAAFVLSRLLQSILLPRYIKKWDAKGLAFFFAVSCTLSGVSLSYLFPCADNVCLAIFLLLSLIFFTSCSSLIRILVNHILAASEENSRASVLSLLSSFQMLAQAAFSLFLSVAGLGVPTVNMLIAFMIMTGLSAFSLFMANSFAERNDGKS